MKPYPFEQLIDLRELRLSMAQDAVRIKQATRRRARDQVDERSTALETVLARREERQRRMIRDDLGATDVDTLTRMDLHISHLADLAGKAAMSLSRASDRLGEAETDLAGALTRYHKLHAKRDALEQHKQRWVVDQRRAASRGEESAIEDLVQSVSARQMP